MSAMRDSHIPNPTVVNVSPAAGEFLFFRLEAGGPVPNFQFSTDVKGTILNQGRFPNDPADVYEWTYLKDPSDIQQLEIVTVALIFVANKKYRLKVKVNGPDGPRRDVLDIDYTGADFDTESFRILIQ